MPSLQILASVTKILETSINYILFDSTIEIRNMLTSDICELLKDLSKAGHKIMLEMMRANKEVIIKMSELSSTKKSDKKKK